MGWYSSVISVAMHQVDHRTYCRIFVRFRNCPLNLYTTIGYIVPTIRGYMSDRGPKDIDTGLGNVPFSEDTFLFDIYHLQSIRDLI